MTHERGSAIVEFLTVGVLLILPLVYLVVAVLELQRATFGATQAAREAGRVLAVSGDEAAARYAAAVAMGDQGMALAPDDLTISCPASCLAPGGEIGVVVRTEVALPLVPPALVGAVRAVIPVTAEHVVVVDRFRETA